MAINIRKDGSLYLAQVVDDYNALIDAGLTTEKHRDKTSQQNGTDLIPCSTPLIIPAIAVMTSDGYYACLNAIQGILSEHMRDSSAHLKTDSSNFNFDGYAFAHSATTAYALANCIKLNYNSHGSQSGVHLNADSSHQISSNDATSPATLVTLITEFISDINAHIAAAGANQRIVLVPD